MVVHPFRRESERMPVARELRDESRRLPDFERPTRENLSPSPIYSFIEEVIFLKKSHISKIMDFI